MYYCTLRRRRGRDLRWGLCEKIMQTMVAGGGARHAAQGGSVSLASVDEWIPYGFDLNGESHVQFAGAGERVIVVALSKAVI